MHAGHGNKAHALQVRSAEHTRKQELHPKNTRKQFWGCFWAANELIHERIMAKLKRLAKHGNKNRMATLANNWDIFQTANWWLLEKDMNLNYKVTNV
jgi:hypothetical protein